MIGTSSRQPGPADSTSSAQKLTIPQSDVDRLLTAAYRALPLMPEEIREQVAQFLTPQAVAVMAGVAAVFIGSQFLGVGEVLDVILGGVTVLTVGWDAIKALRGFARYYDLAVHARSNADIDAAAKCFADAMLTAVAAIGWGKLGKWLGKGVRRAAGLSGAENAAAQLTRWRSYINAIEFKIPRDQGMLWSKVGGFRSAETLAESKGLTSLEMLLKKNGFYELYSREFGSNPTGAAREVTGEIWKMISKKYVQSLEGKVTGYVHRATYINELEKSATQAAKTAGKSVEWDRQAMKAVGKDVESIHGFKQQINTGDAVLVTEVDEISKILLSNPKITELTIIDVQTGEAFGYRSRELLESLQRLEGRKPSLTPHLP